MDLFLFILIGVLVLCSFFFSASETSIIGLSKIRLRHLVAKGSRRAASVQRLVSRFDSFIAAILISNNFVNIALSAIITGFMVRLLGYQWGVVAATFITTVSVLVFCEITPKILAMKNAEKTALLVGPLMEALVRVLQPLVSVFIGVSNGLLRLIRITPTKRSPLITQEELRTMIEIGKEEGVLSDEERKMLHRIFEFGDTRLKDVMVPLNQMVAVNARSSVDEILDVLAEKGHSRLPVYQDSPDNVIGVLFVRDLLYILKDKGLFVLQDLLREPYFVKSSMRVNELLRIFQQDKVQLAIVVDEKKKAQGVVTLEDLLEEIVGEIEEDKQRRGAYRRIR
jgi:CBS domain containing-hemolysin-like protein